MLSRSERTKRGQDRARDVHLTFADSALAESYRSLVIEFQQVSRQLKMMNDYAASLAASLSGKQFNCQECRAGKPDGQPDAPSLRPGAALSMK